MSVGILNVGAGDTKLTFDRNNPAEAIRAARIVRDMIRRGYALLIEVERDGKKVYERALDFDEERQEYIIADLDPMVAHRVDAQEGDEDGATQGETEAEASGQKGQAKDGNPDRRSVRRGKRRVPASSTRAVAVSRSAGG